MDDILKLLTENGASVYLLVAYVLIKDVLPKFFPQLGVILSKRISTEERLFKVLEDNTEVLIKLNLAFVELSDTLKHIDDRIEDIEQNMADNTSALRIASRLIAKD